MIGGTGFLSFRLTNLLASDSCHVSHVCVHSLEWTSVVGSPCIKIARAALLSMNYIGGILVELWCSPGLNSQELEVI